MQLQQRQQHPAARVVLACRLKQEKRNKIKEKSIDVVVQKSDVATCFSVLCIVLLFLLFLFCFVLCVTPFIFIYSVVFFSFLFGFLVMPISRFGFASWPSGQLMEDPFGCLAARRLIDSTGYLKDVLIL